MAITTAHPTPQNIDLRLDSVPAAPLRRPRVLLVATSFAAAGSVATFLGLIGVYLSVRSQHLADGGEAWLPTGVEIPLSPGNMSMVTLAMSLVTVQWAVHSGSQRDRGHAYLALGLTILFGVAHVTQLGYLFTQWGLGLNGETGGTYQAVLLYTIIGLHIAMVAAALLFLALMLLRSLGGQFTGRDAEGLSAAALYWYATVAVFAVLWYSILIVK